MWNQPLKTYKPPPSFSAGKKSNKYFCLAFDNELPPIPQIVDKKCRISFKKVSGNQERKSTDKLDKQMHRSRYMLEKEATIFNQVTESSSTCDPFTSATSQSWPNVSTKQWPHILWRAPCFWWKYRSATRIYTERCQMESSQKRRGTVILLCKSRGSKTMERKEVPLIKINGNP